MSELGVWNADTAAASLGFSYPANSSTSFGRFGPNFLFTVVRVELQSFTVE